MKEGSTEIQWGWEGLGEKDEERRGKEKRKMSEREKEEAEGRDYGVTEGLGREKEGRKGRRCIFKPLKRNVIIFFSSALLFCGFRMTEMFP